MLLFWLSLATFATAQVVYSGQSIPSSPTTVPSNSIGVENSWYLDLTSKNVYGPKTLGQWPQVPAANLGGGGGSTVPGGASGSIQYNNAGAFGGFTTDSSISGTFAFPINSTSGLTTVNGSITTNHCLKWGPGITDAGATCGSGGSGALTYQTDVLTITATNTLSATTQTYSTGSAWLAVNGAYYPCNATGSACTISGTTVTWNSTNAGFSLTTTGYNVAAIYPYGTPALSGITIGTTSVTGGTSGNCLTISSGVVGSGACGGGLTIGTTTIAAGTNGYFLYNNGGSLGNAPTTGTGSVVLATSPTLTTPNLGTPSALTLTNAMGLPLAGLASEAANTIVGNGTGSSASPAALAVPSCSTSSSALYWTSGTGFGCHTISATGPWSYVACNNNSGDSALIQNAINALASTGGTIQFGNEVCDITSAISQPYSNIWLMGAGSSQPYNNTSEPIGTIWETTIASGDVLTIGSSSETSSNYPQNCKVSGITFQPNYSTTSRTGGWAIHKYPTNRCLFYDIDIESMYNGFLVDGTYSGSGNLDYNTTIQNSFIEGNGNVGIQIGTTGSTDTQYLPQGVYISFTDMSTNGSASGCSACAALYVLNVGGLTTTVVGGVNNASGEIISPGSGQFVSQFSTGDGWDTSTGYYGNGLYIHPTGGTVSASYFNNLWASSSTGTGSNGLEIYYTSGTVTGLTFTQCHFVNNEGFGAYVASGSYINFTGCNMQVNNISNTAGGSGLGISGSASHVTVNGGIYGDTGYVFGNGGTVSRQYYGIVENANNYTLIEGVDTTGNKSSSTGCGTAAFGAIGASIDCSGVGTGTVIGGNM